MSCLALGAVSDSPNKCEAINTICGRRQTQSPEVSAADHASESMPAMRSPRSRSRSPAEASGTAPVSVTKPWVQAVRVLADFERRVWASRDEADANASQLVTRRLQLLKEAGEALGYPPESKLYSASEATQLQSLPVALRFNEHLGPGRPCRVFSPRTVQGRSIREQNLRYSSENHIEMALDVHRVAAFQTCIQRAGTGRRVLDVGSGAFCLLGRLALKAGAVLVHCVEQNFASVLYARELFKMEMAKMELPPLLWLRRTPAELCPDQMQLIFPSSQASQSRRFQIHVEDQEARERSVHEVEWRDPTLRQSLGSHCGTVLLWPDDADEFPASLELHQGLCEEIPLPGEYDLVVHEILGYMASSEGVVPTIRDLHARQLPSAGCLFIPAAAGTYFAPTERLEMTELELALHSLFNGEQELAVKVKYNVRHFDPSSFLASPEIFEWFCFGRADTLTDQQRTVEFRTTRDGYFDGLHFHLLIDMDRITTLDVLAVPTTWCTTYVRLLEEAIFLPANSLMTCRCRAAAYGPAVQYSVEVWLGTPVNNSAPLASFEWAGCS